MNPDRVGVVIVTWNAADLIGPSLASVPSWADVVVVDNDSADDTVERSRAIRADARIIERSSNAGFAAGANVGIDELTDRDAVLLLNPDCHLAPGALEHLVQFLRLHPRAGLVSALICGPDGRPERHASGRDPSLLSIAVHYLGFTSLLPRLSLYSRASAKVAARRDWVAGTALLARRTAIDEVGPLDESYFLYAEDHDWCHRMRDRGWEVWVTPGARAEHLGAASVSVADESVRRHRVTSLDTYYARGHRGAHVILVRLVRVVGYAGRASAFLAGGWVTRRALWTSRGRAYLDDTRLAAQLMSSGT